MTLEEIKAYLRIEYEEDDELLSNLIEVSENYIDSCVGSAYKNDEKAIKLANLLQKKLIADMFENRGTEISNSTKRDIMVTSILDKLSLIGD
ncbi:phage head-tail connector protein [Clostridium sp. Sa3CUN1]|uniref:Phage head-tail connector protein n=1 Tax=Clostridium gallinarum TaxID=2762246 RepID=A0ABR8Q1B7_9CLOT|nr:head-tail connector protein [Clostridium gallinarum]MBD7914216.1 phage head-tail connector protein [Clostridium gallinarum]